AQQSIVKRTQMFPGACGKCRQVITNLRRAISQLVDLKTTALDLRNYFSFTSQTANNFNTLARNQKRNQLVVDSCVLNQRVRCAEHSLKLSDREKISSRLVTLRATMLELARNLQQLTLALN